MKMKKFDSINVIPFIDILLVLLAIVLLTSTFIAKGVIPVSLPTAASASKVLEKKSFTITIKKDNTIYCNAKEIKSMFEITRYLHQFNTKTQINIKSDMDAKFGTFVSVLDLLKSKNYENISIVTKKP